MLQTLNCAYKVVWEFLVSKIPHSHSRTHSNSIDFICGIIFDKWMWIEILWLGQIFALMNESVIGIMSGFYFLKHFFVTKVFLAHPVESIHQSGFVMQQALAFISWICVNHFILVTCYNKGGVNKVRIYISSSFCISNESACCSSLLTILCIPNLQQWTCWIPALWWETWDGWPTLRMGWVYLFLRCIEKVLIYKSVGEIRQILNLHFYRCCSQLLAIMMLLIHD